jgi:hypothetical protein
MRRKLLVFFISMLLIEGICFADTRSVGDDYQFQYTITDIQGIPVSGQYPYLKIKKVSSNAWYDFSDDTFKTSGVSIPSQTLSEDAIGQYYYYTFVPPTSETYNEQYSFIVGNNDTTYADYQIINVDYLDLNTSSMSITNAVWNSYIVTGSTDTASDILHNIDKDTNGVKDGGSYNGVEKLIKQVN